MNPIITDDNHSNNHETAEDFSLGEQIVFSALQNTLELSFEEKMEVMEALQLAPDLVRSESVPLQFLKVEKFDAVKAAKRLAKYWKFRKQIFGNRAFQPLTLLGDGAMESSDIEAFRKGFHMPLPEDALGRSVVFLNQASFCNFSPVTKSRCGFYMCQIASEFDGSATKGFRMITMVAAVKFTNNAKNFASFLTEAFPVKFASSHLVMLTESDPDNQTLANYAAYCFTFFGNESNNCFFHTGSTPDEIKEKLVRQGFREEALPACCGGPWGSQNIDTWMTERMQVEQLRRIKRNNLQSFLQQKLNTQAFPNSLNDTFAFGNHNQIAMSNASLPNPMANPLLPTPPHNTGGNLFGANLPSLASLRNNYGLTSNTTNIGGNPSFDSGTGANLFALQGLQAASNASGQPIGFINNSYGINSNPLHQAILLTQGTEVAQHNANVSMFARLPNNDVHNNTTAGPFDGPITLTDTKMPARPPKGPFEEALDSIPNEDKYAYLEALQKAPHLISTESDPKRFMAVENNSAWAAARRFVTYWKIRKELFSGRAFLPMTQTGSGALSRQDILNLGAGANAVLPDDKDGCPVFFGDRSRRLDDGDKLNIESRFRILFYILHVASENPISQQKGIVSITMVVTQRVVDMDLDVANRRVEISKAIPIKIKNVHLVVCPPKTSRRRMVDRLVSLAVHVGQQYLGKRAILHMDETPESMLEILKGYGFKKKDLPSAVGGTWKYEEFTRWMRQRVQLEQGSQASLINQSAGFNGNDIMDETEEERNERKRRLNIIFSRQKRERRKAETNELASKRDELVLENERLKEENERLEKLFKEIQEKIVALKKG